MNEPIVTSLTIKPKRSRKPSTPGATTSKRVRNPKDKAILDVLVEALGFYGKTWRQCRNRCDQNIPGTKNDWNAEICDDGGDIARAALAKVEVLRKKV